MSVLSRENGYIEKISPLFIALAGTLWGTMGFFVRGLNAAGLNTIDVVAVRAIFTAAFMALFLLIYNPKLLRIKWKDIWCFAGTGLCSIVFFNYCYFRAISMTSLSVAAVLLYTAPAFVMILSRFLFGEKLTLVKIISLIATFIGCMLVTGVFGSGQGLSAKGILIGLGAGLGYALYSIFSRYALEKGYHSFTISFYTFLIAAIGTLFLADIPQVLSVSFGGARMFGYVLLYAIVSTVLPYVLYTLGLKRVENGRASIIASVEPVVATLLGVVLYDERLSVSGVVGVALVLGAIVLCNGINENRIKFNEKH